MLVFAFESARAKPPQAAAASSQSRSLYSFGDSFVDPGNNDYIPTNATSNFPPYGNDFPGKVATGRFSNGLLFPDLLGGFYDGFNSSINFTQKIHGQDVDFYAHFVVFY